MGRVVEADGDYIIPPKWKLLITISEEKKIDLFLSKCLQEFLSSIVGVVFSGGCGWESE